MGLLPVLAKAKRREWGWSLAASVLLAVALAVTAGLQPANSRAAPERLNLSYAELNGKAQWIASAVAHLPDGLRHAAAFSAQPREGVSFGYAAPAGAAQSQAPTAKVTRSGDDVTVDVDATGEGVMLVAPEAARLKSVSFGGVTTAAPPGKISIVCVTPDCARGHLVLHLESSAPWKLLLRAERSGLPPQGAKLLAARPATATPSGAGDRTILAAEIAIPGR
jgi:hypothetical protein